MVLDVVYNHTYAAGPSSQYAVLDKLVPGYYHRRMEDGEYCMSTCCNNTASENLMFERLVSDDLVHWAKHYRVDGFRFDIMGHHMVSNMKKWRKALDGLTLEGDGVDGAALYIYGEAWDFGEMAYNQRGRNAGQANLAGTRLGSFNDRIRDAVLGGGPFDVPDAQGFITGLYTAPNTNAEQQRGDEAAQRQHLNYLGDLIRLSLAGNLKVMRKLCTHVSKSRGRWLEWDLKLEFV